MFIGEFQHTIDEKRRVSLPSKIRKECDGDLIATRGLDTCLYLYTKSEWKSMIDKLKDLSLGQQRTRDIVRYFFASAEEISIDASGRILLPEKLVNFAGIASAAVTIIGAGARIEIWNEETWKAYEEAHTSDINSIAESLGELGIL